MKIRKALSLILALVMAIGLMTVPSFAEEYINIKATKVVSIELEISSPWRLDITIQTDGNGNEFADDDAYIWYKLVEADNIDLSSGVLYPSKIIIDGRHTTYHSDYSTKTGKYVICAGISDLYNLSDAYVKSEPFYLSYGFYEFCTGVMPSGTDYIVSADDAEYVGENLSNPVTPGLDSLYFFDFEIDLETEVLSYPDGFPVKAYSIDGGNTWKTGVPDKSGDISKLLAKGCELWLTDAYDKKTKGPQVGALAKPTIMNEDGDIIDEGSSPVQPAFVVKFPAIEGRPDVLKYAANYKLGADSTGLTNGTWKLSEKGSDLAADIATLQICIPHDGKKFDPKKDEWGKVDPAGIPVKDMANGKTVKTTYLYRIAPVDSGAVLSAASKTIKVTAVSAAKAPALKPDYKKEVLKTKKETMIFFGDTLVANPKRDEAATTKTAEAGFLYGPIDASDKTPIDLSTYLSEDPQTILVWTGATEKKPASMKQTILLAPRAYLTNCVLRATKGKISLGKTLEVFDSEKNKYGKLPKATAAFVSTVRLRNTAKAGKLNKNSATLPYVGLAASRPGTISADFGVYETKLDKNDAVKSSKEGYLGATITAPSYAGRIALIEPKLTEGSVPIAFGGTPGDFKLVYTVVSDDLGIAAVAEGLTEIRFMDTNTTALVTFGTPAVLDSTTTPATLTIPIASILGAGTVNPGLDSIANSAIGVFGNKPGVFCDSGRDDGDDGVLLAYKDTFYVEPFSFEIAGQALTPVFDANGSKVQGNLPDLTLAALNGTESFKITGLTGLLYETDYEVTTSPANASLTGLEVTPKTGTDGFAVDVTGTAGRGSSEKITITVTLKNGGNAGKTCTFADGASSYEFTLTVSGATVSSPIPQ